MFENILSFFTDPVLRAPTIGCMLMCLAAGMMGVIVFLRKESLIGEALSHASYPGIILGIVAAGMLAIPESDEFLISLFVLGGAFISATLGLWSIQFLQKKLKIPSDAALCFVLSTFFGVGLTIASQVQFSFTSHYKQALSYIYGQAATMTDAHILIYGVLVLSITLMIFLFYKEIQMIIFDCSYAKSLGINVRFIERLCLFFIILATLIGIRSVGVILMSAMLIAPAAAARKMTNRLSIMFLIAGIIGLASGFFGNFLSVEMTDFFSKYYSKTRIVFPTGPMIVLFAGFFCFGVLLLSPLIKKRRL